MIQLVRSKILLDFQDFFDKMLNISFLCVVSLVNVENKILLMNHSSGYD
jgi:hypothetical protein